jgi:hypothetical protein
MQNHSLRHLPDHVLVRDLHVLVGQDRGTTATLLAHIAEVDRRRLYAEFGYSSMFTYCLRELGFSGDMAAKRIRAARTSRRFPGILDAITDGRLHVTAVCLLTEPLRHLNGAEALELLVAAEHKTKEEIRVLLAERFPRPDLASSVRALPADAMKCVVPQVPEPVPVQDSSGDLLDGVLETGEPPALPASNPAGTNTPVRSSAATDTSMAASVSLHEPHERPSGRTAPLSPGRFALQLTMTAETREKLQHAQDLLAPGVPRNDLALLLDRALDALIEKIERRRFGATENPRTARPSKDPRHISASVRRVVTKRDRGQCTFVSDSGRRCDEKGDLDFDHILSFADGGASTASNLRLRCHAHNQLAAERRFGAGFMQEKRERARAMRGVARAKREHARADGQVAEAGEGSSLGTRRAVN